MAFGKIKPKKASADVLKEISQQAQEQRYFVSVPRSEDPENFPVFGLGNESYLVYVPNLTTLDEEGREALLCKTTTAITRYVVERVSRVKPLAWMGLVLSVTA